MNIIINVVPQVTKDIFRILTHWDYDFTYAKNNHEFCIRDIYRFNSKIDENKWVIWTKGLTPLEIQKDNIISFEVTKIENE